MCAFSIREKSKKISFVVHMQGWGLKVRSIPCLYNGERWSCGNRPLPDQESQLENEQLRAAPLQNQIAPKSFDSRTLNGTMNSKRGEKTPTPKISALLRKQPVLLRANFVLTEDRNGLTTDIFVVKYTGRGLVVKQLGVLSKAQMLNLVLGVGVFSLLPRIATKHLRTIFILVPSSKMFSAASSQNFSPAISNTS